MAISIKKLDLPEIDFTDVWAQYKLFESTGEDWRYQMAEDEDFFLGNQLTDAQKIYLESVGQPPEANNKIRPAVETVLANIAAASPEWDVRPIGKTDNDMAFVCNQMLDWVWRESDGDIQFRKACKDFIIKGISYFYVYPGTLMAVKAVLGLKESVLSLCLLTQTQCCLISQMHLLFYFLTYTPKKL